MEDLSERIHEALSEVHAYAGHVDDWITIKKEILKSLPPQERRAFSTRHPITKKQSMNEFERKVANQWEELTGRPVIFKDHEKVERS